MKKNKVYSFPTKKHNNPPPPPPPPMLLEKTKETTTSQEFEILVVPPQPTPTLEEETNNTIVKSSMHLDPHEHEESSWGSIFLDSCFNDMVIDGVLEGVDPNGLLLHETLGLEETQNGPPMDPNNKLKAIREEDLEISDYLQLSPILSNNPQINSDKGSYYCSSPNSYITSEELKTMGWANWDNWDGGVEGLELWNTQGEKMLSWPWDDI